MIELTKGQKETLISEVKEYSLDGIIFLYELGNVYKKDSNMWNMMVKKIEFLYEMKNNA